MQKRAIAVILIAGWAAFAQQVHLKTRTIRSDSPARAEKNHQIVQFDHAPTDEDMAALLSDGVQVVAALPDNAVVVAAVNPRVVGRTGITWIGDLDAADKLSPLLDSDALNTAIVEFHSDVPLELQTEIIASEGITVERPAVLASTDALVTASMDQLKALAEHDEVAYIFPGDPELALDPAFHPCAGMLTTAGPVAQYANLVHGWDLESDHAVHLGYVFGSITPKVPAAIVQSEIVRAFNEWAKNSNVAFEQAGSGSSPRTILVKFASGNHGDNYPFDGRGGMLAHTYYPVPVNAEPIAGDMHLDADENWHAGSDLDVYSVALHEAGHALGLGHSDKPGDVMYPYYRSHMTLSSNDIGALQALYGAPAAGVSVSISTPPTGNQPPGDLPLGLRLTLDSVPSSTALAAISVTGTLSGGSAPYSLQWQTDRGYGGAISLTGANAGDVRPWTASTVPLAAGSNTLTFTAFDSAHRVASQTAAVVQAPANTPSAPLKLAITSPASTVVSVSSSTLTLAGTASGSDGVARVTWQTTGGATGTAVGTAKWVAAGIPLLTGTNSIVVRAYSSNGAGVWSAMVAVRH